MDTGPGGMEACRLAGLVNSYIACLLRWIYRTYLPCMRHPQLGRCLVPTGPLRAFESASDTESEFRELHDLEAQSVRLRF